MIGLEYGMPPLPELLHPIRCLSYRLLPGDIDDGEPEQLFPCIAEALGCPSVHLVEFFGHAVCIDLMEEDRIACRLKECEVPVFCLGDDLLR